MILDKRINWINKKTNKLYRVLGLTLNCTNDQKNAIMIMYKQTELENLHFVQEHNEFFDNYTMSESDASDLHIKILNFYIQLIYKNPAYTPYTPKIRVS